MVPPVHVAILGEAYESCRPINSIWTGGGGGAKSPELRVFAEYLKNFKTYLHQTLRLFRPAYRSSFEIKNSGIRISSQMMVKLGRVMRQVEIF